MQADKPLVGRGGEVAESVGALWALAIIHYGRVRQLLSLMVFPRCEKLLSTYKRRGGK